MKVAIAKAENYDEQKVRKAFDELFSMLGYDEDNPLNQIVKPGDKVFIKPNWVAHEYRKSCGHHDSVYSTITHPMVIRVMADYVAKALQGEGEIVIGDNPSIDADFDKLMQLSQLQDLETKYDVPCRFVDLRPLRCVDLKDYGKKRKMKSQEGDSEGSTTINLGKTSLFNGINPLLFRGVFTNRWETIRRHFGSRHDYTFSNSIVNADVYISIPKLKTHHKVGMTLNLKGLVGAISDKNLLVHWRIGWPGIGGDEYPSFGAWLKGLFQRVKKRGAWSGNDTIWRMVVDIYNAFNKIRTRRVFSVVDGIVGGEGDGPFCPVSKESGVLLAGEDLLAVDCVAGRLMGFDVMQIPYLRHFVSNNLIDFSKVKIFAKEFEEENFLNNNNRNLGFLSPGGWDNLC
ncbi:MAG: DUF362 domain-containing protein [Planctomycetes bacterium]|nr:DUF362 domain-containing protein [Planctomycetota bacterium]